MHLKQQSCTFCPPAHTTASTDPVVSPTMTSLDRHLWFDGWVCLVSFILCTAYRNFIKPGLHLDDPRRPPVFTKTLLVTAALFSSAQTGLVIAVIARTISLLKPHLSSFFDAPYAPLFAFFNCVVFIVAHRVHERQCKETEQHFFGISAGSISLRNAKLALAEQIVDTAVWASAGSMVLMSIWFHYIFHPNLADLGTAGDSLSGSPSLFALRVGMALLWSVAFALFCSGGMWTIWLWNLLLPRSLLTTARRSRPDGVGTPPSEEQELWLADDDRFGTARFSQR